jgi:hypothetical protein
MTTREILDKVFSTLPEDRLRRLLDFAQFLSLQEEQPGSGAAPRRKGDFWGRLWTAVRLLLAAESPATEDELVKQPH